MPATVVISETNGAGATVTDNISNGNYGSVDSPNLSTSTNPIAQDANSYEKYWRFKAASGTFTQIDNLRVYRTTPASLAAGVSQLGNARTSGYVQASYAQPVQTDSTKATVTFPNALPGSANLGINGQLSGQVITLGSPYSDYLVTQLQTTPSAAAGETMTVRWQYDEVA